MPNGNAQDVTTPLGKMLRFDVDNPDTPPGGNLTAADVGSPNGFDGRIYHWGLRNPFRWSFDRLTGDLYIGDVGQDTCEEVDVLPADSGPTNFGWSSREGTIACPGCGGHTIFPDGSTAHEPIFTYPTDKTKGMDQGCSKPLSVGGATNGAVIGGYVYRGSKIPGMYGRYIFTDFERKTGSRAPIFALTAGPDGKMCDFVEDLIPSAQFPDQSVPSFAEDSNGELYVINMTRGEISRIDPE
jgi:glucose/arabinose dehydrogenase